MSEIDTAGAIAGGVAGGLALKNVTEDVLQRLLGPSAEYIGKNWGITEKGIQNWEKVFRHAIIVPWREHRY